MLRENLEAISNLRHLYEELDNHCNKHFLVSSWFGKAQFIPTNSRLSSWPTSLQLKINTQIWNYINDSSSCPMDLRRRVNLQNLGLSHNHIHGWLLLLDIVSEISRHKHLDHSRNKLNCLIHATFNQLLELQVLNIFSNFLNAAIPSFLRNLLNLL